MEVIGWIGSLAFALCGLPQVIQSIRDGHSRGLNSWFLFLWCLGEACTLAYVLPSGNAPLITNYVLNGICLSILVYYKLKPRRLV